MYMHVEGHGDPVKLAATLHAALALSGTPFATPARDQARLRPSTSIPPNWTSIIGQKGKVNGGVYQFTVPRAEPISDAGMAVPRSMGTGIAINFQPTGEGKAAITGDFVLTASEVNPVLLALREHGIEVTALHNHMLNDEPRLFFMHFWANADAQTLASPDFSNTDSRMGHVSEAGGGIGSGRGSGAVDAVGTNSWTSGGEHPCQRVSGYVGTLRRRRASSRDRRGGTRRGRGRRRPWRP